MRPAQPSGNMYKKTQRNEWLATNDTICRTMIDSGNITKDKEDEVCMQAHVFMSLWTPALADGAELLKDAVLL